MNTLFWVVKYSPSPKPCTGLGEVDGSGFVVDLDAVGEAERAAPLPLRRQQRPGHVLLRPNHSQPMVGVRDVQLPRLVVELEAQWTPTLVLPARVLRASAAVQPALVKFQTSMKLQCFACLPRIMEWWDLYFLSTSLICQSQSQRCSSSALAFLFFLE